jgi:predicted Zn-dependent protease
MGQRGSKSLLCASLCIKGALLLLTSGCASTSIPPLKESQSFAQTADEQQILREGEESVQLLAAQGMFLEDAALQSYIDGIGARLAPSGLPHAVRLQFRIIREPTINAFALPQGSIQIHMGLLARLENEAQLAHVMAHEITHTTRRHQLRMFRNVQNKTVAAKVAELALLPAAVATGPVGGANLLGLLLNLGYAASITGYGRDMEQEADVEGLRLLAAAGYPVEEAARTFELLNEGEDPGGLENFLYGSHPLNAERSRYTRERVAAGEVRSLPGANARSEAYLSATQSIVYQNIRLRQRARHYAYAVQEAQTAIERRGESALLRYALGESHRLAAEDPDGAAREAALRKRRNPLPEDFTAHQERVGAELDAAEKELRRALELDPALALAHRGLGLAARQRGDRATARAELAAFLASHPSPQERRPIERILKELQ